MLGVAPQVSKSLIWHNFWVTSDIC
jgi:hypothetical protein